MGAPRVKGQGDGGGASKKFSSSIALCPFCACEASVNHVLDVIKGHYRFVFVVICTNCQARGPVAVDESNLLDDAQKEQAIERWNHLKLTTGSGRK